MKRFTVDAKAILTLGRNSIKDATTAVVELVKNSYDADAEAVELSIQSKQSDGGQIRIADNGHGMSAEDVEKYWLRIGYSEKVDNKISTHFNRRKTGEKGIGRLAADRLGKGLQLRSKKQGKEPTGLALDWSKFESPGLDLGSVEIPELADSLPKVPKGDDNSRKGVGTELIIQKLRQTWTHDDVAKLHSELSLLLPPYPELAKTFRISFSNDVAPELDGLISYDSQARGEIDLRASISSSGRLSYGITFFNPRNRRKRQRESRKIAWRELRPDPQDADNPKPFTLGAVEIRLSYYVRNTELLEGSGFSLTQLRQFLDRNAGVRIYRDMVRVKPYGDPNATELDWLGLGERKSRDPAGARRRTFKIAPNQLVGAVFAGRDTTPELIDSSSREGLLENDAFRQLRVVLMRCVEIIESKYHELSRERPRKESRAASAQQSVQTFAGNLSALSTELSEFQDRVSGDLQADFEAVAEQISLVIEQAQAAQKDIEEIANQSTVYRGLATVGIASAIFGHETSTAISQADAKVRNAIKLISRSPADVDKSKDRLNDAVRYMERVASWGRFALSRVNRDKRQRRKVSVSSIISGLLDDLEGPMGTVDVDLRRNVDANVEAKTFHMDIEAILINLLTNAYHEVKRHSGERIIRVRLSEKSRDSRPGVELKVDDNGGGISREHETRIWEPLFSTKTDERGRATGTGLGLAIVKSATEELGGECEASAHGQLGGASFRVWIPSGLK